MSHQRTGRHERVDAKCKSDIMRKARLMVTDNMPIAEAPKLGKDYVASLPVLYSVMRGHTSG